MVIAASIALVIFILAPGGIYLYHQRARRTTLASTFGEDLLCGALVSVVITSFTGLILLELSLFRMPYLLGSLALITAIMGALALRSRVRLSDESQVSRTPFRIHKTEWLLLGVLAVGLFLRVPPSLYVHGGQDQGVYLGLSQHFVRTGKIFIHDPILEEAFTTDEPAAQVLRPVFEIFSPGLAIEDRYEGRILPQFYIADKETGRVVTHFFHLHPMWLALFSLAFGFSKSVYALTFFALLALAIIYYLSKRVFKSEWTALLAAGLLAVNILQVWTNRFPVSETLAQVFLFGGLLFYCRWRSEDDPRDMWLGAACLGLYAFTRAAGLILLPMYVIAFWLAGSQRRDYIFYNLVFLFNLYVVAHAVHFCFPYFYEQIADRAGPELVLQWYHAVAFGLGCVLLINLFKLAFGRLLFSPLWRILERHRLPILLVMIVLPAVPFLLQTGGALLHTVQGVTEPLLLESPWAEFLQLMHYITLPGLVLAVIGIYSFFKRCFPDRPAFFILVGLSALIVALIASPPNRYQFYYGRYYVAELLPFALMFAALGTARLWENGRHPVRDVALLAMAAFMLLGLVTPYFYCPAYRLQELRGAYPALQEIVGSLPEDSVTFVGFGNDIDDESFYIRYGTPVMFIGDRHVLPYRDLMTTLEAGRFLAEKGREVRLLMGSQEALSERVFGGEIKLEPVGEGLETVEHTEMVLSIPHAVRQLKTPWYLYRFRFSEEKNLPITIVPDSEIAVTSGFYPDYRKWGWSWTESRATISDITIAEPGRPLSLKIALSGHYPSSLTSRVRIEVNGECLFDRELSGERLRKRRVLGPIRIPARLNRGTIAINLETDPWTPAQVGINPKDHRPHGLDIRRLTIRPEDN
ncbi:MAG: hypothetical protein GTO55_07260 [Armatimonadetes bacterium]|nr:hypothetical protein [Armatimonadota bacterium]NIM24069.1 hypothetical protein [Armatimonadota bacterium]NIM67923.1 hypothetical protein [Armatimonadota bacterium]NIM76445.1 hypothetical protein [Armatimonadota bacterium]NIN06153.1 hypothetical protein [Armatimonadota bacterium]